MIQDTEGISGTKSALKSIICPKCGKRMLIEVDETRREHRCPICKAAFLARLQDAVLSVEFPGNN